jgi:hypothetical protein
LTSLAQLRCLQAVDRRPSRLAPLQVQERLSAHPARLQVLRVLHRLVWVLRLPLGLSPCV